MLQAAAIQCRNSAVTSAECRNPAVLSAEKPVQREKQRYPIACNSRTGQCLKNIKPGVVALIDDYFILDLQFQFKCLVKFLKLSTIFVLDFLHNLLIVQSPYSNLRHHNKHTTVIKLHMLHKNNQRADKVIHLRFYSIY